MTKLSIALIAMGIIMSIAMTDVTAACVVLFMGIIMLATRKLGAWRKRTNCKSPRVLNFVDAMLRDE